MKRARSYGAGPPSRQSAETTLVSLLYGCTDERLAGFSAESLSASYAVPLARATALLAEARRLRK